MNKLNRRLRLLVYGSAMVALIPVFPFLVVWLQGVVAGALVLGVVQDLSRRLPGAGAVATLGALVSSVLFVTRISPTHVIEPIVHILCVLLAVRLITEKNPRNILQIFLLSTIILAASSLLTLNMQYLGYLLLLILLQGSGLILLCFVRTDPAMNLTAVAVGGLRPFLWGIPAVSVMLMAGLFLILPRTPVPLWNIAGQEAVAIIGMSDQVRPGTFSDLASSGHIAFRAEMEPLPATQLYWRGIVMGQFDGEIWQRAATQGHESLVSAASPAHSFTIHAEPKADRFLVTLDRTATLQGVSHRAFPDGTFQRNARNRSRISYRGDAQPGSTSRSGGDSSSYLDVPATVSVQLRELAATIAIEAQGYEERVAALERFFVGQQLSYSARNLPQTSTPLETFLFDARRGYCEYFASSFAVLLRLLDIPARLVGGYLGGSYNRFGNYYLVTEDRAHVWVEALDDDGYWRRIDPSRLAVDAEQTLLSGGASGRAWQYMADALFHYWTGRVLNYDLRQQLELFRESAGFFQQFKDLKLLPWPSIVIGILLLPLLLLLLKRRQGRLIHAYLRQVAGCCGIKQIPPGLGLYQLAQLTREPLCRQFADIYGTAIYMDKPLTKDQIRQLRRIIRQLKGKRLRIGVAFPATLGDNRPSICKT